MLGRRCGTGDVSRSAHQMRQRAERYEFTLRSSSLDKEPDRNVEGDWKMRFHTGNASKRIDGSNQKESDSSEWDSVESTSRAG